MAVTKLSNSGIKTGVLKYDSMLAGNAAYDPAATWLIQRINGTGSAGTITFSSIPSTYTSLQVRWMARSANNGGANETLYLRMNSSSTGYAWHYLYGYGTSASAGGAATQAQIYVDEFPGSTVTANIMGAGIIDIHNYASTTQNKTIRTFAGDDRNGSGHAALYSGLWANTSAVTSLTLYTASGQAFSTSTTFALYGMKG